jgi:cytochrome c biogenesis protein CcdA
MGGILFGFLAGLLSTLSPCVLPLLALVLGPALAAHRLGPAALAAGLALSFVAIGLFVATLGFSLGLDGDVFRNVAAGILLLLGLVLLSDGLQARFALATGGVSDAGSRLGRLAPSGLPGQFVLGLLLGAVWSPCVGPTLGAASLLAAQGHDLPRVTAIMLAFGIGAALPLLAIGTLSRAALARFRTRLMRAGSIGKRALGVVAIAIAAMILTGTDRGLETALVTASPPWLTALTTRF